ncbi:hypothetical protein K1719_003412 [Acacia pycnantha]|nr:hypothetical protein K1719_003412 [Acacia pycnantha]
MKAFLVTSTTSKPDWRFHAFCKILSIETREYNLDDRILPMRVLSASFSFQTSRSEIKDRGFGVAILKMIWFVGARSILIFFPSGVQSMDESFLCKRKKKKISETWLVEVHHSVGRISEIENDGLLIIDIPNRPIPWQADPSDMEKLEDFKVGDWVKIKSSVPSPRYGWDDVTQSLWKVSPGDVEQLSGFEVGDWIRSKPSIGTRPSYDWNGAVKDGIVVVHSVQDSGYLELALADILINNLEIEAYKYSS